MTAEVVKVTGGGKFAWQKWRKSGGSSEMVDTDRRERESERAILSCSSWKLGNERADSGRAKEERVRGFADLQILPPIGY